jgi:eukaryotic-like serine/threonine-protein kinase
MSADPTNLFGYDVVSRLGQGAGSALYVVCDPKNGQLYCLKHVIRREERDLRFIEQLQNEFEMSRHFRHPVLRRSIDLKINKKFLGGITDAALVLELVDGTPLEQQPLLPIPRLLDVFMDVAQALHSMHFQRLVHCDLKPHNILTCSDGGVKLIDFGQTCKNGTVKERMQGTPDFIAPEQVRLKAVSGQTDVFCFGATLYWALTGQKIPTLYNSSKEEWRSIKEQKYPSPHDLNPQIPEPLSRLAMWCCKVSLGSRPNDIQMVIEGLRTVQEAIEASAPPPRAIEPELVKPAVPAPRKRSFDIPQTNPLAQ